MQWKHFEFGFTARLESREIGGGGRVQSDLCQCWAEEMMDVVEFVVEVQPAKTLEMTE